MADFIGEKECGPTHSFACECRESMFRELDNEYAAIVSTYKAQIKAHVILEVISPRLQKLRKQLFGEEE